MRHLEGPELVRSRATGQSAAAAARTGATVCSRATEQAEAAAARAGVTVCSMRDIEDLEAASELFTETWGGAGGGPMGSHLLKAFVLSGNYVAGAVQAGGGLVGVSAGLAAIGGTERELHSHVTAVRPAARGAGIGRALKLHQRAWALDRQIKYVTWTFDPLVRRNAVFNLARLGARPAEYLHNVYGKMRDEINRDDTSDRLWLRWDLESSEVDGAAQGIAVIAAGTDGAVPDLVRVAPGGGPEEMERECLPGVAYRVEIPPDIEPLRRAEPVLMAHWRTKIGKVFSSVLGSRGAIGISSAGDYVVRWGSEGTP